MKLQKHMRRRENRLYNNEPKTRKARKSWQTDDEQAFRCGHCKQMVYRTPAMGTQHRNHCPYCLWSKHVDTKPGNRRSTCHGGMAPMALTFKRNGYDKYGQERLGDIMLVHQCRTCGQVNINRIAGDDSVVRIGEVFKASLMLPPDIRRYLRQEAVLFLDGRDEQRLCEALFGRYTPKTLSSLFEKENK